MSFSVGEIGNTLLLTVNDGDGVAIDLSTATSKQIKFKRDDKTEFTKNLSFYTDGSDGVVYYEIEDGDLSVRGFYEYMLLFTLSSGDVIKTKIATFNVLRAL